MILALLSQQSETVWKQPMQKVIGQMSHEIRSNWQHHWFLISLNDYSNADCLIKLLIKDISVNAWFQYTC